MSGRSEDIPDLVLTARPGCEVEDLSARTSIFAVQGPGSLQALAGLADVGALSKLGYFTFAPIRICDVDCVVGRLGFTGEPGFEILMPRPAATELWELLARRARPAGFAAADILRIEAGFVGVSDGVWPAGGARGGCLQGLRCLARSARGAGDSPG